MSQDTVLFSHFGGPAKPKVRVDLRIFRSSDEDFGPERGQDDEDGLLCPDGAAALAGADVDVVVEELFGCFCCQAEVPFQRVLEAADATDDD